MTYLNQACRKWHPRRLSSFLQDKVHTPSCGIWVGMSLWGKDDRRTVWKFHNNSQDCILNKEVLERRTQKGYQGGLCFSATYNNIKKTGKALKQQG